MKFSNGCWLQQEGCECFAPQQAYFTKVEKDKVDKLKKPTVYAQFVYNTDPFKHFGDGQEQLNLDGANINGSVEKEKSGNIDAVDWYDGRAAVRVGIRWDI